MLRDQTLFKRARRTSAIAGIVLQNDFARAQGSWATGGNELDGSRQHNKVGTNLIAQ